VIHSLYGSKLKAYWSARPVEAMVSMREGGIVYLHFSGLWIALNPKEKLPVSRMRNHFVVSLKPPGFKLRGLIPHLFLRLFQLPKNHQLRIYLYY